MGVLLKDSQVKTKSTNKRRRKKRRTEDFSSDSSSSSSSSDSEPSEAEKEEKEDIKEPVKQDINLNGIDFNKNSNQQIISDETKLKISNIKISNNTITTLNKDELQKISKELDKEEQDLHNEYLVSMMQNYDQDLDDLRLKPDFTGKSLPILAKILKNGANIFDDESLKTILRN